MDAPVAVLVPLLSPNELESRPAAIHAPEGAHVNRGQPLVTLETTNTSVDVKVEAGGYVAGLRARVGDLLRAGDRIVLAGLAERLGASGGATTGGPVASARWPASCRGPVAGQARRRCCGVE